MASRFKNLKKVAESRGLAGSSSPDLARKKGKAPAAPAPRATSIIIRPPSVERPTPAPKRKAPTVEQPSSKRKATAAEKGKKVESDRPIEIDISGRSYLPREERDAMFKIPSFPEPRLPGLPNDSSVFEVPGSDASWRAYQGLIFERDQSFCDGKTFSTVARMGAHHLVALANIFHHTARRVIEHGRDARELREKYDELAGSASREKVEELEERLAMANSRVSELEERLRSAEESVKKADADLMAVVSDKSQLESRVEQLRAEALDARKVGEAHGREAAAREKDAEFRDTVPAVRRQAVEDFVRGPIFKAANLLLSASDFTTGWNRAVGQIKLQGATFDESKLDMSLDENARAWEDDDEEADPMVEGDEFEVVMPIIEELAKANEEKIAAAAARAAEKASIESTGRTGDAAAPPMPEPEVEIEPPPTDLAQDPTAEVPVEPPSLPRAPEDEA